MRRLVYILGFTTALFIVLSIYLANELRLERERIPPAHAASMAALPEIPNVPPAGTPAPASLPGTAPMAMSTTRPNPLSREAEADFLAQMSDPVRRQSLLAEEKLNVRARSPRLAQHLDLTDEEYDQFLDLLAEQSLGYRESHARCTVDPDCNFRGFEANEGESRERELVALIGPERRQRFAEYQQTLPERQSVTTLRANLSDTVFLPEQRAEELIGALADERNRINAESVQRGVALAGYGTAAGMLYTDADAVTYEGRLESARKYSQRLRERASGILTPEQLRVFNQMQDELLAGMGETLRRQAAADLAGN